MAAIFQVQSPNHVATSPLFDVIEQGGVQKFLDPPEHVLPLWGTYAGSKEAFLGMDVTVTVTEAAAG